MFDDRALYEIQLQVSVDFLRIVQSLKIVISDLIFLFYISNQISIII